MKKEKVIALPDPQLGEVLFRKNIRAKKYIIRIKSDLVSVTIPKGGSLNEAKHFFQLNRLSVIRKKADLKTKLLSVPKPEIDETILMQEAKRFLPGRLSELADLHGFTYRSTQIRKSKTRWGSCSSKKTICLSFYLMLLPSHLITYVLLHELCHTVEMNHGPKFWSLLDRHTNGYAKTFRTELNTYKIP
jgi:predicted metal-dependent hydrolase